MPISQPARLHGGGRTLTLRVSAGRIFTAGGMAVHSSRPVGLPEAGDELVAEPAEEVVDEALRHRNVGVLRVAPRLEAGVGELLHIHLERHAVLEAHRHRRAEGIHQPPDRAPLLRHRDEQLAGAAVVVEADGDVALMAPHIELVGDAAARVGETLAPGSGRHLGCRLVSLGARVEGLALLRAVTVDRQGLQPHPPAFHVGTADLGRGRLPRHVDRLGDRPRDEWLRSGHHLYVGLPGNRPLPEARLEGTVEDGEVLLLDPGCPLDRVVVVDGGEDRFDRRLVIPKRPQRQRHGLVDDLEHPAASELLVLHQGDVGLDAGGVAVHQKADRAGRGEDGRLSVAVAVSLPMIEDFVPHLPGCIAKIGRASRLDLVNGSPVRLHDSEHRLAIGSEALEGADCRRELGAGAVGRPVEDRRDRPAQPTAGVAVIGQAVGHQQAAEV